MTEARFSRSIVADDQSWEAVVYLKPGMTEAGEEAVDLVIRAYPLPNVAVTAEFAFTITDRGEDIALHRAEKALRRITASDIRGIVQDDPTWRDILFE